MCRYGMGSCAATTEFLTRRALSVFNAKEAGWGETNEARIAPAPELCWTMHFARPKIKTFAIQIF